MPGFLIIKLPCRHPSTDADNTHSSSFFSGLNCNSCSLPRRLVPSAPPFTTVTSRGVSAPKTGTHDKNWASGAYTIADKHSVAISRHVFAMLNDDLYSCANVFGWPALKGKTHTRTRAHGEHPMHPMPTGPPVCRNVRFVLYVHMRICALTLTR